MTTITTIENGPAIIHSDSPIVIDDSPYLSSRIALCRCGASKKQPFCDGSHSKIETNDKVEQSVVEVRKMGGEL